MEVFSLEMKNQGLLKKSFVPVAIKLIKKLITSTNIAQDDSE